jgi:hypothetical protein
MRSSKEKTGEERGRRRTGGAMWSTCRLPWRRTWCELS